MLSTLWLSVATLLVALCIYGPYRGYHRNLAAAKQSGLPYVWIPIPQAHPLWLLVYPLFLPLLKLLPQTWTYPWIVFLHPDFAWYGKYKIFQEIGGDVIIIFSPFHLQVCVGNAEAIHEITTTQRNSFPKDLPSYERLSVFGPNMLTADGALWRYHRKLTYSSFAESNMGTVWQESLSQAQIMFTKWIRDDVSASGAVWDLNDAATTLALHVVSKAAFGQKLHWPHEDIQLPVPEGYEMSYSDSLEVVLRYIGLILLFPSWLLRSLPFKITKRTYMAFEDWKKYQRTMYLSKVDHFKAGGSRGGLDLLGAVVEGTEILQLPQEKATKGEEVLRLDRESLSEEETLSNIFVLILAGHETSANVIFLSNLLLAMQWSSQERLQKDLDDIFGDKPVREWDFDTNINKLSGSMCGAVMNETLRVIPPVLSIPKTVSPRGPVKLTLDGQEITIPAGATVMLHPPIAGSNPRYWPHTDSEDLNKFRPERWLLHNPEDNEPITISKTKDEDNEFEFQDKQPATSASLFRPVKGSYIPFSEGQRSCIGRRFAQVEVLAVLAFIFKHWSVELDVSLWMSDEELLAATEVEKREVWQKAKARAQDLLANGMSTIITLQLRKGRVPLKFVRRGCETFKMG